MIDLHSTTDAVVWAKEFIRIVNENDIDALDESFLVTWFANAFAAQEMNQTAVQAIEHAVGRAAYHQIVNGPDVGSRELAVAITKLDEARMWFTRGLSMIQRKFNPADLEQEDE